MNNIFNYVYSNYNIFYFYFYFSNPILFFNNKLDCLVVIGILNDDCDGGGKSDEIERFFVELLILEEKERRCGKMFVFIGFY